jgi:hypothetical protein
MLNRLGLATAFLILFLTAGQIALCSPQPTTEEELKAGCLAATITAIKLEIERNQGWILQRTNGFGNAQDLPELKKTLRALEDDLAKYQNMNASEYELPEKEVVAAWVREKPGPNSILYLEHMSKSGPWYHVAGIVGDDYGSLRAGKKLAVTFYRVYQRGYWYMNSAYVYVAEVR